MHHSSMEDLVAGEYTPLARLSEIRERRPIVRIVNGHEIAVFRVGEDVYAVSNVCPHQHAPVISEGPVEAHVVTCPMHGWRYDLRTGRAVDGSGWLRTFELRIDGESVMLLVPEAPGEAMW
jgi:nitrite reductase/ring-hydroxylating ferredoxin subunit